MLEKLFLCAAFLIPTIVDASEPEQDVNFSFCYVENEKLASNEEKESLLFAAREEEAAKLLMIVKAGDEEKTLCCLVPNADEETLASNEDKLAKDSDIQALYADEITKHVYASRDADEGKSIIAFVDEEQALSALQVEENLTSLV